MVETVIPSRKQDASGALGPDSVFAVQHGVWEVPSADRLSVTDAVSYLLTSHSAVEEGGGPPPSFPDVGDVFDVDLDAEGQWGLSDIPLPSEIDICSRLRADRSVIIDKCSKYSIEDPQTADDDFNLALIGLNTLGEHCKLLVRIDALFAEVPTFEAQMKLLESQLEALAAAFGVHTGENRPDQSEYW